MNFQTFEEQTINRSRCLQSGSHLEIIESSPVAPKTNIIAVRRLPHNSLAWADAGQHRTCNPIEGGGGEKNKSKTGNNRKYSVEKCSRATTAAVVAMRAKESFRKTRYQFKKLLAARNHCIGWVVTVRQLQLYCRRRHCSSATAQVGYCTEYCQRW